jgi:hypothetical protein
MANRGASFAKDRARCLSILFTVRRFLLAVTVALLVEMKELEPLTPYMPIQKSDLCVTASTLENRANAN